MDIHSNLEYLCRVCAANTKGKNSVAESVYILKTAGLKDKLDKFLFLKISENDSLPKVLCKSCFRQVEATASLSKIAKHTQEVFRDFLLSSLPKGPSENAHTSEFTSSDFMGNKDANEKTKNDEILVPTAPTNDSSQLPTSAPAPQLPPPSRPPLLQPLTTTSRKGEVIVNVSVTDPLTRDNQQKMISNSQRRQSLLIESRYTPKSIAQKPAATNASPRLIAPKPNQQNAAINTANNTTIPVSSLNFYPLKTQQPPQSTQITTFSSGGYVIGRINTDKEESKKITLPDNILQQKRKNLVKALNNIKANNSGQVSLLKSSQQKQAEAMQNSVKSLLNEVVNQAVEDELPEKIIIAAPKNKSLTEKSKKEPLNLSSKVPGSVPPPPAKTSSTTIAGVGQQQQEQASAFNATLPKPAFPDDILLGRVIRDMDLLKLILKALKWPVNKQNMELQLQRLKNSKFTDIISDANLLQDTDLTQLLSPYLAPVLLAAQALQQQQQQLLKNTTLSQNVTPTVAAQPKMTALEAAQAEINKSIPYKLPPETSVQLVPATPEETEATQSPPLSTMNTTISTSGSLKRDRQKDRKTAAVPQKRQRKTAAQKARDSIVISDEEDASTEERASKKSRQRSNKSTPNIHIELNPNFMSQFNLLNGSGGANEAEELMALLMKQKAAVIRDKKIQRRRRNSVSNLITLPPSEFDALIDLDDDIVLMEPVTTTSSSETSSSNQELQQQKTDITNTFVIPSVPLITRPIIKRRKTVIHPPKNIFDLSVELKNKDQAPISSAPVVQSKEKLMEETINQVATGIVTNVENITKQTPAKTVNNEGAVVTPKELTITKTPQQKKMQNKSTLGQQLLEAIGLQQTPPTKMISNPQAEAPNSTTLSNAITALPNSKQSIQQIRTALKKSLKQAQEQQQQKKKELSSSASTTVIQDADSTTKPAMKEIVVVEGKGNKSSTCSSMVDVEEQIDKVTLMVRKNDEKSANEKDEKKEMKKLPSIKVQERGRSILATGTRGVAAPSIEDKQECNEEEQEEKIIEDIETTDENEQLHKDDSANISSSSGAVSNELSEATSVTNNQIIIPKRRGRKRLVDKLLELEAAEALEREKAIHTEEDSEAASHNKNEEEAEGTKTSGRPTRQSKTQSKYYKGPDKPTQGRRFLPSRTTRNRKYC